MTRWLRCAVALLLCGVGVLLGPAPTAAAADPPEDVGLGTVIGDLGTTTEYARPGFSYDGGYFAYLVPADDQCELHVYDVSARRPVDLAPAHIVCDAATVRWAPHADTLVWQVAVSSQEATVYAWDARPGRVSTLATDAHVFPQFGESRQPSLSADGRFLAFVGWSTQRPAPAVDDPADSWFVFDRSSGKSVPLSRTDLHVEFGTWAPSGAYFVADTGGHTAADYKAGTCYGSGNACTSFAGRQFFAGWSLDGTAVMAHAESVTAVHDFTDGSTTPFPGRLPFLDSETFLGNDRVVGHIRTGTAVWNRRTGEVFTASSAEPGDEPRTGRHLLFPDPKTGVYHYVNAVTRASALAAFRGPELPQRVAGYWTEDGKSFVGIGADNCTALKQWAPATNTVSYIGPPGHGSCFQVPYALQTGPRSSASGRFALFEKSAYGSGSDLQDYVVDLRRHVLLGPLHGYVQAFAPAGSDVLAVGTDVDDNRQRLLLVDPTPVPDVNDKPRWSAWTPPNGERVEAAEGEKVTVRFGASVLQRTPVYLAFRWRNGVNLPVSSAPAGWSCDRRQSAGGAVEADCTFAPPHDPTATRYLDVWAVNSETGAKSDTRSYRVKAL